MLMLHFSRKFVAVLLAVWLPLFSGNALAVSIAMQSMGGDSLVADIQIHLHQSHQVATTRQHVQHTQHVQNVELAAIQDHSVVAHGQHDSSHKKCGVCHLACCGFMATVAIEVAEIKPDAQLFVSSSTQFQSFYSAPLVPPPLARA